MAEEEGEGEGEGRKGKGNGNGEGEGGGNERKQKGPLVQPPTFNGAVVDAWTSSSDANREGARLDVIPIAHNVQ